MNARKNYLSATGQNTCDANEPTPPPHHHCNESVATHGGGGASWAFAIDHCDSLHLWNLELGEAGAVQLAGAYKELGQWGAAEAAYLRALPALEEALADPASEHGVVYRALMELLEIRQRQADSQRLIQRNKNLKTVRASGGSLRCCFSAAQHIFWGAACHL